MEHRTVDMQADRFWRESYGAHSDQEHLSDKNRKSGKRNIAFYGSRNPAGQQYQWWSYS